MKKMLYLAWFATISLFATTPERIKLAKKIIHNKSTIVTLREQKRSYEAQLGVLNTTRELQRKIEAATQNIDTLTAENEMLFLTKYNEGPQLRKLVESLEKQALLK